MPEIDAADREEFLRHFPVSHETLEKFERYAALLKEWNAKFNLVADSTLPQIWRRHFLDSAQLIKYAPKDARTFADLGSGAGFPGIVLSLLGAPKMYLIESTGKKAEFLRTVVSALDINAEVMQVRIEDLKNFGVDVVTARALKPLPELLALAKPLMRKTSMALFLKGQHLDVELTESTKYWRFENETFPSLSDPSGRILAVRGLERQPKAKTDGAARHKR